MTVNSGKYGVVNGAHTVRRWVVSETTTPAEFRASNTLGGTGREEGIYDYNGSFEGYGGVPPVMPGEYFDFLGYTAPVTGAYGTSGPTKGATNAICNEVTVNWNWQTGELLNWALTFASGEPQILADGASIATDIVVPQPKIVCGTKILLNAQEELLNVVSASLTITSDNPTYVNSSTLGKTGRRRGIVNWTASIQEQAGETNAALNVATCLTSVPGGNNIVQMYCDAVTFWDLTWGHLVDITDLRTDMDTGEIIEQTLNFAMNGFDSGVAGWIGRPGEDGGSNPYWWPDTINAQVNPF